MFTEAQKVYCDVPTASGGTLTKQNGIVLTVEANNRYKVYVLGLVLLADESQLSART